MRRWRNDCLERLQREKNGSLASKRNNIEIDGKDKNRKSNMDNNSHNRKKLFACG